MVGLGGQEQIGKLLGGLLDDYDPCYGLGSMTCSVYDTAWVACVSKTVSGRPQWLFPLSFFYVLNSQLPDGGWAAHQGEQDVEDVDGILSTMAALFCLIQHERKPLQIRQLVGEYLPVRIEKAVARLSQLLGVWQVNDCKTVGFEVIVPSLLELLQEDGFHFEFPFKELLLKIRNEKLTKLRPELLYSTTSLPLLHSLEAFHGRKDFSFDRISHQKIDGSVMASPSATASYLMRCTKWDDDAEAYLRLVISNGEGRGSGAVPSAYPSTNFELTWVASTLLEAGVWDLEPNAPHAEKLLRVLEQSRKLGGGLVGFAPGIEPDLDDSAKSSIIFSLLGKPGFAALMVEHFDSIKCLKTYIKERNTSVSANCNALLAIILDSESYRSKNAVVQKVTTFICDSWWTASLDDKWSSSSYYPAMLMARCLTELLHAWDVGKFSQIPRSLLQGKVMPALFQCMVRTLQAQRLDGSWGRKGPREETAYAIITLASLIVLPLAQFFRPQIISAIGRGRSYLNASKAHTPEYLWIEKVSYGSANLAEAYVIAALHTPTDTASLGRPVRDLCSMHYKELAEFGISIDRGPLSQNVKWLVLASRIESWLCVPHLQRSLEESGQFSGLEDHHQMTAFRWVFANNRTGATFTSQCLCDMMTASLLNDRLIAFVDDAMASDSELKLEQFKDAVDRFIELSDKSSVDLSEPTGKGTTSNGVGINGDHTKDTFSNGATNTKYLAKPSHTTLSTHQTLQDGNQHPLSNSPLPLFTFTTFFASHPRISLASPSSLTTLHLSLSRFLHAQRIRTSQAPLPPPPPKITTAFQTGYPHLFTLLTCLCSQNARDAYPTPALKYIAEDVRTCTSTILALERQLRGIEAGLGASKKRSWLEEEASYERARLALAVGRLEALGVGEMEGKVVRLMVEVADLAGGVWEI